MQPKGVQGKLLCPQNPLFGTRLFVCAKNWVLRAHQGFQRRHILSTGSLAVVLDSTYVDTSYCNETSLEYRSNSRAPLGTVIEYRFSENDRCLPVVISGSRQTTSPWLREREERDPHEVQRDCTGIRTKSCHLQILRNSSVRGICKYEVVTKGAFQDHQKGVCCKFTSTLDSVLKICHLNLSQKESSFSTRNSLRNLRCKI